MTASEQNGTAFLDPAEQGERFRRQVLSMAPGKDQMGMVLALPPHLLENTLSEQVIRERLACWLGQYFPPESIRWEGWVRGTGMEQAVLTIVGQPDMLKAMNLAMGRPALPDMRELARDMDHPDQQAERILERLRHCEETDEGLAQAQFSVPRSWAEKFEQQVKAHYGAGGVAFGPRTEEEGPMVTLGATLSGTAADLFINDMAQYQLSH